MGFLAEFVISVSNSVTVHNKKGKVDYLIILHKTA